MIPLQYFHLRSNVPCLSNSNLSRRELLLHRARGEGGEWIDDRETGNKNLSQKLFLSLTFHNSSASVLSPFVCSPSLPLPHSSKRSKRPHPPAEGGGRCNCLVARPATSKQE